MRPLLPYTLRALARLLAYPDDVLRVQLPDLANVLQADPALPAGCRHALSDLVTELLSAAPLQAEAAYVDTFDRHCATSLNLFEHVHGASHARGPAMIDLLQTYEQAGMRLQAGELPDHLSVVLEFASTLEPQAGQSFLCELTPILSGLHATLKDRGSRYAAVPAAVVALAGDTLQTTAAKTEPPLDATWAEPQAFGGCERRAGSATQPVQFVARKSTRSTEAHP